MRYELIDTAEGQVALRPELCSLFRDCFGDELKEDWWRYLYLDSPAGCAVSIVARDDQGLVGHYAANACEAVGATGRAIRFLRGITLAIEPRGRAFGVFRELVLRMKDHALQAGFPFVLGFPNEESHVPLRFLCGWETLHEADPLVFQVPAQGVPDAVIEERATLPPEGFCPPYTDAAFMKWRRSIRDFRCHVVDNGLGVVAKLWSEDTLDVMDAYRLSPEAQGDGIFSLAREVGAGKVWISSRHAAEIGLDISQAARQSDYTIRMACMPTGAGPVPDMRFSLLFSDVY